MRCSFAGGDAAMNLPARKRWHGLAWSLRWLAAPLLMLALFAGCTSLDQQQRRWIFQPSDRSWYGGSAAAEGMQDVWIEFRSPSTGAEVRLHGLWAAQAEAGAPVLLYLHGAGWNIRGSAHRMRRMHELGFAVLGIDYRGFGQSSSELPSEESAFEDAQAAWQWLALQAPEARRYVFGHSLGGAIAVHLASEVGNADGLIVEGSFTSIPDVVGTFRWGWLPVGPLITQRFDAASRAPHLRMPVLVVHGSEDRLISPELGRALYERAPHPKRFLLVEGGSHHNTNAIGQTQYRQALGELFGIGQCASAQGQADASNAC
jgi:hypothetical protein